MTDQASAALLGPQPCTVLAGPKICGVQTLAAGTQPAITPP
jgi:hypothetical protein